MHYFLNEPIEEGYRIAVVWGSTVTYLNGVRNHVIYTYRCGAIGGEVRYMVAQIFRRNKITLSVAQQEVLGLRVTSTENSEMQYRHSIKKASQCSTGTA